MASFSATRALVVLFLIGCSLFGSFATLVTGFKNGLFDTITNSAARPDAADRYIPGGPKPYPTGYTGIDAIDNQLLVLITFFTFIIDGPQTWDITLSYWFLMTNLCTGWCLVMLEGLRKGNRGKLISWTSIVGLSVQNLTYTFTIPLYLALHLLVSPVAWQSPDLADQLVVNAGDLALLPYCSTLSFIAPAIMMSLPSPYLVTVPSHYSWNALWQIFPIVQNAWQWGLKQPFLSNKKPASPRRAHLGTADYAYGFVIFLTVASQLGLLAVALVPPSAVSPTWAPVFEAVDLQSAFVPYWPWNSPKVDALATPIPADGLAELSRLFLQWDMYCGGFAILAWAVYLHGIARPSSSAAMLSAKVLLWTALGGPVASAAVVLWDRDEVIGAEPEKKRQ